MLGARYGDFKEMLYSTFLKLCCYCESPLYATSEGEVERFRPVSVYPQLALDWRNLYLACPACNRAKASRFPVVGGHAPKGLSYDEVVKLENPLLLDPCDPIEHPDRHLIFLADGRVAGSTERGRATVETLALNRSGLVDARLVEVRRFLRASEAEREAREQSKGSYAAVWRQLRIMRSDPTFLDRSELAVSEQRALDLTRSSVSTEGKVEIESYKAVARYVERVKIENFGPIRILELDFSKSVSNQTPCFALLGENGVGKSTVLRAISIALAGKNYAKRLRLTSNKILAPNAYSGSISVSVIGQPDVVMTFRRNKPISFSVELSSALVLAYGATRLLPRGRHKAKRGERHAKIDNLFDPFVPLTDADAWLADLDPKHADDVRAVVTHLLPVQHGVEVVLDKDEGRLRALINGDSNRRLRDLSDGYQAMLGMAFDVIQVMHIAGYKSMQEAQGVVLVDELGNHFHPAWRLRCVTALRNAFPQVQFIFSTHDPLCLRGLLGGEVAVLRRDGLGHIYALDDLPEVNRMRVEQLLSSEHFGLRSTLDPAVEELAAEYEALVVKVDRTPEDELRMDEIVRELTDVNYLGTSRRERLALQLLDNEREVDPSRESTISASSLADVTVARLRRLMQEISPIRGRLDD